MKTSTFIKNASQTIGNHRKRQVSDKRQAPSREILIAEKDSRQYHHWKDDSINKTVANFSI
jgi:hypothetical protein